MRDDPRTEAYLDGELSPPERARYESDLARSAELRTALAHAQRVQDELRLMPQPRCPQPVTAAVLAEAQRQARDDRWARLRAWAASLLAPNPWRPALAVATVAVAIVAGALWMRPDPLAPATTPTTAEVNQATRDVKWALALVSEAGQAAGRSVRDDVLGGDVLAPVQHALGTVLPLPEAEPPDSEQPSLR